mmetsp:Transcript_35617/g.90935  ORF Transcript_35617/g.90935 Transcript_35617/m.90935 type:complete len:246 (+) Transcript_35617:1392-2129(+)
MSSCCRRLRFPDSRLSSSSLASWACSLVPCAWVSCSFRPGMRCPRLPRSACSSAVSCDRNSLPSSTCMAAILDSCSATRRSEDCRLLRAMSSSPCCAATKRLLSLPSPLRRSASVFRLPRLASSSFTLLRQRVISWSTSCSSARTPCCSPLLFSRSAAISFRPLMASIRDSRSSWYPPVMGPRVSTRSPSSVMESKLVERDTWLATSRSLQIMTLPKICMTAGVMAGLNLSFFIMGTQSEPNSVG